MYILGLSIAIVFMILSIIWVFSLNEKNIVKREKLARSNTFGIALTIIDFVLLWSHLKPVLPAFLVKIQLPLVIIAAVLAILFLDYLFSRALGGFLILGCYFLVHENFYNHGVTTWVFPALCYLLGIGGIFIAGKPVWLRDYFRKCEKNSKIKYLSLAVFGGFIICLVINMIVQLKAK